MATQQVQVGINFESEDEARALADEIRAQGGSAEISSEPGLLPLAILLWVVIPPGIGLLAIVANRIAHSWTDKGTLIDARGDGPPQIVPQRGLQYGTVVILTRDGDESKRTDLPEESLGDYINKAVSALTVGVSASDADQKAAGG